MRFEYYPDTHSLYIELNTGRKRKPGGTQEAVGWGSCDIVIGVDGYGEPVGIDIGSFASEIVDLSKLEAEGPIFGVARVGGRRDGLVSQHRSDRPWHERILALHERLAGVTGHRIDRSSTGCRRRGTLK